MKQVENFDIKEIEKIVSDDLKNKDVAKMIQDSGDKTNEIMFIEGPPTMNGIPHAGHLRGRVFKDLWYRYNVLLGNKVIFNAGWDTQGLPVELQAEKELGIENGKNDITTPEDIERLVTECKKIVKKYGVQFVLGGGIQVSGNKTRINVELKDLAKNDIIWSEIYDFSEDDIFNIQDQVGSSVSSQLQVEITLGGVESTAVKRLFTPEVYKNNLLNY